jgi:hypothetical protein
MKKELFKEFVEILKNQHIKSELSQIMGCSIHNVVIKLLFVDL